MRIFNNGQKNENQQQQQQQKTKTKQNKANNIYFKITTCFHTLTDTYSKAIKAICLLCFFLLFLTSQRLELLCLSFS